MPEASFTERRAANFHRDQGLTFPCGAAVATRVVSTVVSYGDR